MNIALSKCLQVEIYPHFSRFYSIQIHEVLLLQIKSNQLHHHIFLLNGKDIHRNTSHMLIVAIQNEDKTWS